MPYLRNKATGQVVYVPDQQGTVPVGPQNPDFPYKGPQAQAGVANTQANTGRTVVQTQGDQIDNATKAAIQAATISKAKADAANAKATAEKSARDAAATLPVGVQQTAQALGNSEALRQIQQAEKFSNKWSTGWGHTLLSHLPNTDATRLDDAIDTLRTKVALDNLSQSRQLTGASATGGRTTQMEFQAMGNSIAALKPQDGLDTLSQNLHQVEQHYRRMQAAMHGANPDDPAVAAKLGIDIPGKPQVKVTHYDKDGNRQ